MLPSFQNAMNQKTKIIFRDKCNSETSGDITKLKKHIIKLAHMQTSEIKK